uniref:DUF1080 domain-containing protein n=1 Tax=Schlesneria paludicola TaxID=360056 RepID=A0A7C2P4E4_9PLAN
MRIWPCVWMAVVCGAGTTQVALADKGVVLKPTMVKPGAVVRDDQFDGTELGKNWVAAKGDWSVKDGTIVGREKADDRHAAVLTLQQPHRNTILRYSFRLDGATNFNLSFNHAKGHLFRIAVSETGLTITKDKDKKDADSRPVVLAKAPGKFPSGQWHTMLVEIQGDRVSVQTDNGVKLDAHEPSLDVDKTGYRFVMKNGPLLLDDVSVWQVAP